MRMASSWLIGVVMAAGWICLAGGCNSPQKDAAGGYGDGAALDADWQKGPGRPPTPRTLYAMSRVLAAQGRFGEAATVLRRVVQAEPAFLPAYVDLAELHMRQQQPAAAVEVLTAALKVAPQDPMLHNDLGVAQLAAGRHGKALAAFERALALAPGQARYQANAALALAMLGRYDEALEAYERILPPAEAHHNVAVLCEARNDKERAQVEHAQALVLRTSQARRSCGTHGVAAQAKREAEGAVGAAVMGEPTEVAATGEVPPVAAWAAVESEAAPAAAEDVPAAPTQAEVAAGETQSQESPALAVPEEGTETTGEGNMAFLRRLAALVMADRWQGDPAQVREAASATETEQIAASANEAAEPQSGAPAESEGWAAAATDRDLRSSQAELPYPDADHPTGPSTGERDDAGYSAPAEQYNWDALSHLVDLVAPAGLDLPAR